MLHQQPAAPTSPEAVVRKVKDLRIGDEIMGLDENMQETKCTIEAIGDFGKGLTYGNYTEDHFVLDTSDYSVFAHGQVGEEEMVNKYSVLTSCPVGLDESGTGFTPVDSDSLGERLSWADYVIIHKAMLDMVRETGTPIWFSPAAYTDMALVKSFLTDFYQGILMCVADANQCGPLEVAISNLVENSLTPYAKKKAKKAFRRLGRPYKKGSVAACVSGGKSVFKKKRKLDTSSNEAIFDEGEEEDNYAGQIQIVETAEEEDVTDGSEESSAGTILTWMMAWMITISCMIMSIVNGLF